MIKKIITVQLRDQRVSPKKARLVMDLIRGKTVVGSQNILDNLDKKSSKMANSLLKSAVSAAQEKNLNTEDLYISESLVNEGRKLKRYYIRARGRAANYKKRMSHFKISLSKIEKMKNEENEKKTKSGKSSNNKEAKKVNKGKKNG